MIAERAMDPLNPLSVFSHIAASERGQMCKKQDLTPPLDSRKEHLLGFLRLSKGTTWLRTEETCSRARWTCWY